MMLPLRHASRIFERIYQLIHKDLEQEDYLGCISKANVTLGYQLPPSMLYKVMAARSLCYVELKAVELATSDLIMVLQSTSVPDQEKVDLAIKVALSYLRTRDVDTAMACLV